MRLYLCTPDRCHYGQFDAMVVRAPSGEQALALAVTRTRVGSQPTGQVWTAECLTAAGDSGILCTSIRAWPNDLL